MKDNENKTLEQLQEELEQAKKVYELLQKNVKQKETEEADRKKAELAATKDKRKKEIEDAEKHYRTLLKEYIKDYGSYEVNRFSDQDEELPFLFGSKPWRWFL